MSEYHNTNRGVLFNNRERKAENPKAPDYSGSINVEGKEFFLSAWLRESKKGNKFMSLSVKAKEAHAAPPVPAEAPVSADLDDDLPF